MENSVQAAPRSCCPSLLPLESLKCFQSAHITHVPHAGHLFHALFSIFSDANAEMRHRQQVKMSVQTEVTVLNLVMGSLSANALKSVLQEKEICTV